MENDSMSSPVQGNYSELFLLRFSTWMGVIFTVVGLSWGLIIQSGIVLFDGIYSGCSIILSILSILVLRVVNRGDNQHFQFGPVALEPLVVAFKSIVIIGVCLYGIVTSIIQLLNGGWVPLSSTFGMVYAVVSIVFCLFTWMFLKSYGKGMPLLVIAESEQWLMDTVFSSVVLLSFLASYFLSFSRLSYVVPYIDPGIVVVASVYFFHVPLMRFISSMKELLMMAPPDEFQTRITRRLDVIREAHRFEEVIVRSTKIGRELTVDIAFIVPKTAGAYDIEDLDKIRSEVNQSLSEIGDKLWMNILFTKNRKWA